MTLRTAPRRPRPVFAACAGGFEPALAAELSALGLAGVQPGALGVAFEADRTGLWRALLHSRIATRILLPIAEFPAASKEALYAGALGVAWEAWLDARRTLAVDAQGVQGRLEHTGHSALVIKDALCDRLRERLGQRPDVDRHRPDVLVHLRLVEGRAYLSLDASGVRLHRRGYRAEAGEAPLKETLAAGLIARSGWQPDQPFCDPFCGAGTLVIEAALQAAGRPPGLLRLEQGGHFACQAWLDHDRPAFEAEVAAARATPAQPGAPILGSDVDPRVIERARRNAQRAGVADRIRFEVRDIAEVDPPAAEPGVLVCNPPYGERLGDAEDLWPVYANLGRTLKHRFPGWSAWVLVGEGAPIKAIGLKPGSRMPVRNGALRCQLAEYRMFAGAAPHRRG